MITGTLKNILLLAILVCTLSCKNEQRNSYAIKDFRKSLQPLLVEMATKGIVSYHDSSLIASITGAEWIKLSKSENSVLRTTALIEMIQQDSFNNYDLVMDHLDDTAVVAVDEGEFGIDLTTVSDILLQRTSFETIQAKNQVLEQVLLRNNYLHSAFTILKNLEPQEKYYLSIKDMATRSRKLDFPEGHEMGFRDIEYALYGLAKFRRKEDVALINKKLMEHYSDLSDLSFRLMQQYPDPIYLDVLRKYHRRQFYNFSGNRPHGFSGFAADKAAPEDFIQALVMQQNDGSAKLLDTMLMYLPKYTCMPDQKSIIREVETAVYDHPCPAYNGLIAKMGPKVREKIEMMEKHLEELNSMPKEPSTLLIDTTKKMFYLFD